MFNYDVLQGILAVFAAVSFAYILYFGYCIFMRTFRMMQESPQQKKIKPSDIENELVEAFCAYSKAELDKQFNQDYNDRLSRLIFKKSFAYRKRWRSRNLRLNK